jgi:DNA-binding transcriptional LysR family regulator
MNTVHIAAFDLNLLLAFDALWAERNVTRAARRVGLSQSALSHALKRLRLQLGDPLFLRSSRGLQPTPRAQSLAGPLAEALALVRGAVESPAPFDPSRLRRNFTIATSDYALLVLLPPLLPLLARKAPLVTLNVRPIGDTARDLAAGVHDLAVAPSPDASLRSQVLFDDRFVCLLRRGHPLAHKPLTLERFLSLQHVLVSPRGVGEAPVDAALRKLGRARHIAVRVPDFVVAPLLVAETDYLITLPERLVRAVAPLRRLVAKRPPIEVAPFTMTMMWHPRWDADPAHAWLRQLIIEVSSSARFRS